jgi:hypothetical protein
MWKRPRFERLPLSRSTILRLVESLATSCYYACFSCTLLLTPKFVSNLSRHSGILIIFSFHSYWQCTLTLRDVSFVTLSSHIPRSLVRTSGTIVLDTKVGDGSYGAVDCTSLNVFIEKSDLEGRPKLFK